MDGDFESEMIKWGTLADTFLKSAVFLARSIVNSGNANIVVTEAPLSEEEYDELTQANDRNLAIPTIYNFYHGLELLLKGALSAAGRPGKAAHDLERLFQEFKKEFPQETEAISLLEGLLTVPAMPHDNPVRRFCERNKLTPSRFFEALRYPENRKGCEFIHFDLKYNEREGAEYFQQMVADAERLLPVFVSLSERRPPLPR